VIGAGFSGTAVTVALRRRGVPVTLVERTGSYGRGIAYATSDPQHLLNVPAGSMSALADEPKHLLEWAHRRGLRASAGDYLLRDVYGEYVEDVLAAADGGLVERVADEAVRLDGSAVVTAGGRRLEADAVVVATGLSAPTSPGALAGLAGHPRYVADPWDHDAVRALATCPRVLVVGTGLTMIDVALTLSAEGDPELLAVSRNGEVPRTHRADAADPGEPVARPGEFATADELAAQIEARARAAGDWRLAIDSLRPITQELWRRLPLAEKEAFFARHSRRWEVHRTRIAPQIAARLRELRDAGRLRVVAATITEARPAGDRLALRLGEEQVTVDAVVNATGPAWDCREGDNAFVRHLLATGVATPGPVGLGLGTAADGALVDREGRVSGRLFTLGALRRGELWETIAVPELRVQAAELAARLSS
jgi:uncharacterized NAD(P)/FAD-binding protein YdhS